MGPTEKPIGKRHIGVAGTMIMISQFWFSQQGTRDIKGEIERLKQDYHLSQINVEKYFVRKTEFSKVTNKLDQVSIDIVKLTEQVKSFRLETAYFYRPRNFEFSSFTLSPQTKFPGGKI